MADVYSTPEAELEKPLDTSGYGSLEKGIQGQYHFSVGETISEAWSLTKGAKGPIWLGLFFYAIVFGVVAVILNLIGLDPAAMQNGSPGTIAGIAFLRTIILWLVALPMGIGLFMLGLRRAVNAPLNGTQVFAYFGDTIKFLITAILVYILTLIGLILLVIPGIYLMFAYYLSLPLAADKKLSPWAAMETSRKAISKRWFSIAGFFILLGLINLVAAIPLGIGLIWTLPMSAIAVGILYRNMFGMEA